MTRINFITFFLIVTLCISAHAAWKSQDKHHHHHASCCSDTLSKQALETIHRCGSSLYRNLEESRNPQLRQKRKELEIQTEEWIKSRTKSMTQTPSVFVIPVVVHVVYHHEKPEQNISEEQILSQIESLNRDFRRLNSDTSNTPEIFKNLGADAMIEFQMALRDPNGNPTSGITRTPTKVEAFTMEDDDVKYDIRGGKNIWPRDRYMNFWVCNLETTFLGYAQYPGGMQATDGIVLSYKNFGTTGTVVFPYDQGRTVTHEVGHWLNLIHTWGDEDNCDATDFVDDTPNQETSYFHCPTFPQSSCGSYDMYMNYMDYTNDRCMNLFTTGQKNRMHATLNGFRAPLKRSDALSEPLITQQWCDTLNQQLAEQQLILYTATEGGYATGTNIYDDKAKAQFFPNQEEFDLVSGGAMAFGFAHDGGGSAHAAIWRANNNNQPVGIALAQKEITISKILTDIQNDQHTSFQFENPIEINGPFFMGVILPVGSNDSLALLASEQTDVVNAWEMWSDDSWQNFSNSWDGSLSVNLAVFPYTCKYGFPPDSDVIPELTIGPNPTHGGILHLYFTNYLAGDIINLEVYDIAGRRILNLEKKEIQSKIDLDLSEITYTGVFVIRVTGNDINLRRKFIILNPN